MIQIIIFNDFDLSGFIHTELESVFCHLEVVFSENFKEKNKIMYCPKFIIFPHNFLYNLKIFSICKLIKKSSKKFNFM